MSEISKSISKNSIAKHVAFSAIALAIATVLSMFKFLSLPMGGTITILSMFFVVIIGYFFGPKVGITAAIAYGVLQFVIEPYFYTIPQVVVDYILAFGALGLSGFFRNMKHGLKIGYIVGCLGRLFFSFLSGLIFFAAYAPEGMNAAVYSIAYNAMYIVPEMVLTLIIISIPPVDNAIKKVKIMAD